MFDTGKHPRGNTKNKGQFSSKGGGGKSAEKWGDEHGERIGKLRRAVRRMTPEQRQRLKGTLAQFKVKRGTGGESAIPDDPLDLTPDNVKGAWDEVRKEIAASNPQMTQTMTDALAASRILNAVGKRAGEFKGEIDARVKAGGEVTDAEDEKYMAAGGKRKELHHPLVKLSGYRPYQEVDEHPEASKPLKSGKPGKGGDVKPGDVVAIPGLDGRMPFEAKFFPGSKPGFVGVGYSDNKSAQVEMPAESARHFVNDLSGKVEVPANSGNEHVDAVASGEGELLGKGNDGIVFGVGDKVVKVSTTVPFQPFNRGHLTPDIAKERLIGQAEVNNKLIDAGVPGLLRQKVVDHGDKAFAVRDKLDIPDKLTPEHLESVRGTIQAIHDAGYVVGDLIQVGLKGGKPYLYDLGGAQPPRGDRDIKDDWERFELLKDH
jgi:hypothetical protein